MSFVGQCPSCHTHYELEADDVGHSLQCECGIGLFACDVSGFDELPIHCPECQSDYVVDRDSSGETVLCDCGAVIPVPTVIFRSPLLVSNTPRDVAQATHSPTESAEQESSKRKAVVACPDCGTEFRVTRDDLNQDSQCDCGCVFTTRLDANRQLVAIRLDSIDTLAGDEPKTAEDDANADAHGGTRKKPRSWFGVLGTAAVISFLLGSIAMFVMRDRNPSADQDAAGQRNPQAPSSSEVYSSEALAAAIKSAGIGIGQSDGESELDAMTFASPTEPKNVRGSSAASEDSDSTSTNLRLPALAERPLPQPVAARERIAPIPVDDLRLTFDKSYQDAFAQYRAAKELKRPAESDGPAALNTYREQVGRSLGMLQQAHDLGMPSQPIERVSELRYFLTWMYYNAGCLPEASIMGEAVARWGGKDESATMEATMLALQSAQELSSTQWGIAERVGELQRMKSIAEILESRWPDNPQLPSIWMTLARTYDAFNESEQAGELYTRLPESSEFHAAAQLAAGNAYFTAMRRLLSADSSDDAHADHLRESARTFLSASVKSIEADEKTPTSDLMNSKLTLARIDMLADQPAKAVKWLTQGRHSLTKSIVVSKPNKQQVKMPESFVRSVFETLFAARSQMNDPKGAKEVLQEMAKVLGPSNADEVGDKMTSVAFKYVRELKTAKRINGAQIKTLDGLLAPLQTKQNALTFENQLWLAESWSKFAKQARPPGLAKQCYVKAASQYRGAMTTKGFPKKMRTSARLRQAQLLRLAGRKAEALDVVGQVLKETPNIFGLQIEAATTIEELAIESADPDRLRDAVMGPADSAIWGWNKLVTALHGVRYSSSGTEQHANQLLKCQYNLAQSRWLLAKATVNQNEQSKSLSSVSKMVATLIATTSEDQQPWLGRLKELQTQFSK